MPATSPKHPEVRVRLSGTDGNVFHLIGRCRQAAREAGLGEEAIREFTSEVTRAGDFDSALRVMLGWFSVS